MTPAKIIAALQDKLQASTDLSYINDAHIFVGRRKAIANYPVIVIEPSGNKVVSREYPYENIALKVVIAAGLRVYDEEKQFVGDTSIRGILDFENDIKKAVSSDNTLGGECIDMNILDVQNDDAEDYPIRSFIINVEILYRQNITTRA